jgi:hypothetical protein
VVLRLIGEYDVKLPDTTMLMKLASELGVMASIVMVPETVKVSTVVYVVCDIPAWNVP